MDAYITLTSAIHIRTMRAFTGEGGITHEVPEMPDK